MCVSCLPFVESECQCVCPAVYIRMLYSSAGSSHSNDTQALLLRRVEAKKARDFVTADALRDELLQLGLVLNERQRTFESIGGGFLPSGPLPEGVDPAAVKRDVERAGFVVPWLAAPSRLGQRQALGRGGSAHSGAAPLRRADPHG